VFTPIQAPAIPVFIPGLMLFGATAVERAQGPVLQGLSGCIKGKPQLFLTSASSVENVSKLALLRGPLFISFPPAHQKQGIPLISPENNGVRS